MSRMPSVLTDMNAFFADESFAGIANTITLPTIAVKTVDMTLSGFAGDIERDVGKLEKLETQVTISDYSSKVTGFVGARSSRDEVMSFRGALDVDGEIVPVIVKASGFWKSVGFNDWTVGVETTTQFTITLNMFEITVNGNELFHIDKDLNIFRVNGVDRNEAIRSALAQ